jgi:hypothetical protein
MALPVKSLDYAPRWFSVDSSFISRIGWLENIRTGGTIFVEIVDERTRKVMGQYCYFDVLRTVWHSFRNAESKGVFYNRAIKGRYGEQKVG